ncbi:MAG: glycosyltransferase family 2 protein [Lachnospiraceae bacterium]|nr:glycosyltransferase family 2 protein [Lachnospiraceae bacterium]
MKKGAKISIIIPIYNVEQYLSQCLESVITQTLYDIEIICVNDGTKDKSDEIVKEYLKHDNRIRYIEKENGGLSSARNAGIRLATGDYVLFLDSDDYITRNACECLYKEILETAPDIISFGAYCFPEYPEPGVWLMNTLSPRKFRYEKFSEEALFEERGAFPFVWRQCFKREFINKNKLEFDETIKFGEDLVFQFYAFPQAGSISFLDDRLYCYRWYRENSLMFSASKRLDEKYDQHIELVDTIAEYWQELGILDEYKKSFFNWSVSFMGYDLKQYTDKERKKELVDKLFCVWEKYDCLFSSPGSMHKAVFRYLERVKRGAVK